MSSSDFYIAEEDDAKYDDVCDIRKKKNRTNTNILEAFSGLECPGKELHEWESYSKQYRDKFKKAKQCVQRRITTMKKFPARSAANITSRKKHIYPIQVAYAYGKDCLKKTASRKEQELFKNSVDELIRKISEKQPNIQTYFDNSIENSIRSRGNTNAVRNILNRGYYNSNQTNLINKTRELGYNKLADEDKELYLSIINEGFSRNTKYTNELNRNNNEEEKVSDELINIIKKNIKQRRKTKKKSLAAPVKATVNLANLNEVLQSERFNITNEDRRAEFIKRINKIMNLFSERLLIDEKLHMLNDIYTESFRKLNKLNSNVVATLTKASGQPITKKTAKRLGLDSKYIDKYKAFTNRQKIGDDISKAYNKLIDRLDNIEKEIDVLLKTGNNTINESLMDFYDLDLPKYLLQDVNRKILSLNTSKRSTLLSEKEELYNLVIVIKKINTELSEAENKLDQNNIRLQTVEKMLVTPAFRNNPTLLKKTQDTFKELKEAEPALQKDVLSKYKIKTSVIYDLLQEINKKYSNPFFLKDRLEEIVRYESLVTSAPNRLSAAANI